MPRKVSFRKVDGASNTSFFGDRTLRETKLSLSAASDPSLAISLQNLKPREKGSPFKPTISMKSDFLFDRLLGAPEAGSLTLAVGGVE